MRIDASEQIMHHANVCASCICDTPTALLKGRETYLHTQALLYDNVQEVQRTALLFAFSPKALTLSKVALLALERRDEYHKKHYFDLRVLCSDY